MRDINASSADEVKSSVAVATAKKARYGAAADEAAGRVEDAKDRLARLERGEGVAGGLGKKLDIGVTMKTMFTPRQIRRMDLYASTTEAEFQTAMERSSAGEAVVNAADRAMKREVRRVLRERGAARKDGPNA
jgi:hypothetical protein